MPLPVDLLPSGALNADASANINLQAGAELNQAKHSFG